MTAQKGEYKDGLYAPLALIHSVSGKKNDFCTKIRLLLALSSELNFPSGDGSLGVVSCDTGGLVYLF